MMRRYPLLLMTVAAVLPTMASGRVSSQSPSNPARHVWTAEWKNDLQDPGRPYARHITWRMSFTGVEEVSPDGTKRWLSRQWAWKLLDIYEQIGTIAYDPARGRYKINITKTCTGGATLDLGAAEGSHANAGAPALKADCEEVVEPVDGQGPSSRRRLSENVNQMPTMRPPQEGCSVSEAQRHVQGDSVGTSSYSLTISPYVDAAMEVSTDSDYGRFVPVPGQRLTFTAHVRTPTKALFRFELAPEETSHFPGYATNANIDASFFAKYDTGDLQDAYGNDSPDDVFLPKEFATPEWVWQDFTAVETRAPQSSATVTVTAMDFGAVSKLRGFVKVDECGGWQPIKIMVNRQPRDSISIPLDDDNNLMADALEEFRGMDSGADVDAQPAGNGMGGDGFTAFEEYRGFLTSSGNCDEPRSDVHLRTAPARKTLFVVTVDPKYEALLPAFSRSSDLDVLAGCGRHILEGERLTTTPVEDFQIDGDGNWIGSPQERIVNFTTQNSRHWNGHTVSSEEPQRGLVIREFDPATLPIPLAAWAVPVRRDMSGPPRLTAAVLIQRYRETVQEARARRVGSHAPTDWDTEVLTLMTVHELGHAVGIPHHSNDVVNWTDVNGRLDINPEKSEHQWSGGPYPSILERPSYRISALLVEPGEHCAPTDANSAVRDFKFIGCLTTTIVRRGEETSGNAECPMRYVGGMGNYYEPPGSTAAFKETLRVYRDTLEEQVERDDPALGEWSLAVDLWVGRLLRFDFQRQNIPLGKFCANPHGTGINSGAGDGNHAGDAGRARGCAQFIVVNDSVVRGVR